MNRHQRRAFQLNVRMSGVEADRLAVLAAHWSLTCADVVRMLVKREFDELELDRPIEPLPPLRLADIPRGPKFGGQAVAVPFPCPAP